MRNFGGEKKVQARQPEEGMGHSAQGQTKGYAVGVRKGDVEVMPMICAFVAAPTG